MADNILRKKLTWFIAAGMVAGIFVCGQIYLQDELGNPPLSYSHSRDWAPFCPQEGGFSVEMPESPQRNLDNKTEWGISYPVITYTRSDHDMTFSVGYYDRPDSPVVNWSPETLLSAFHENFGRSFRNLYGEGAKFQEESTLFCQRPALKLSAESASPEGKQASWVILPAGNRCYILLATAPNRSWNNRLVERFHKSFKLQQSIEN